MSYILCVKALLNCHLLRNFPSIQWESLVVTLENKLKLSDSNQGPAATEGVCEKLGKYESLETTEETAVRRLNIFVGKIYRYSIVSDPQEVSRAR